MSDAYDFYEKFYDMAENLRNRIEDAILPSVKEEIDSLEKERRLYEKENGELEFDLCVLQNRIQETESRKVIAKKRLDERYVPVDSLKKIAKEMFSIKVFNVYDNPKCSHCDGRRNVIASAPNGQKKEIPCSCAKDKHTEWMLIPKMIVETELIDRPLLLLTENGWMKQPEVRFVSKENIDRKEAVDYWAGWVEGNLIFSSEETAERYAKAAGYGKRVTEKPESVNIVF